MNDWKQQIISSLPNTACCGHSFLSLILKYNAIIDNTDNYIMINLEDYVIDKVVEIVNKFYPSLEVLRWTNSLMLRGNLYNLLIDANVENFNINLFDSKCCKLTILKTLFVLYGNFFYTADSSKNSRGYRLELILKEDNIVTATQNILLEYGFKLKQIKRQYNFVLYTKQSEQICDLLVLIGAVKASLDMQNSLAMREIRNNSNRQNNCFAFNLDKTITASSEQMTAINYLYKHDLVDSLDESLKDLILLRLANPDVTLNELKTLMGGNISRAGIKYRLDKIIKIYNQHLGEK